MPWTMNSRPYAARKHVVRAWELAAGPRRIKAVRELPRLAYIEGNFPALCLHQSQRLSGHEVRCADERLVQMQIAARYGLLLVSDQTGDGAIRQS